MAIGGHCESRREGLKQRFFDNAARKLKIGTGDTLFAHVYIDSSNPPQQLMLQWHTKEGWSHRAYWGENLIDLGTDGTSESSQDRGSARQRRSGCGWKCPPPSSSSRLARESTAGRLRSTAAPSTGTRPASHTETPQEGQTFDSLAAWVRAQRTASSSGLPASVKAIVALDRSKRTEAQTSELRTYFVEHAYARTSEVLEPLRSTLEVLERKKKKLTTRSRRHWSFVRRPASPSQRSCSREANTTSKARKWAGPFPRSCRRFPAGAPLNRLGLAQWLIAPEHPLTARVAVNRFWLQVFGTGIVKTAEDFGAQGEPPSHPELLDWLAVQFREDGWDVKRFMKRLVMSATYRQSSRVTPELLAKDPANRLLARGPRFRLDAEMLRDQAFFAGGLLVETIGGPSVKPPQPSGLWEAVAYTDSNTAHFAADTGVEKIHRRSFYTFWKRTAPPPQMTTFDAPSRESCQVRRERTNTPLQALLLMNEPQFIEAARALAERTLREGGSTADDRLRYMFRLVTARASGRRRTSPS